jgi:hypothetical protein
VTHSQGVYPLRDDIGADHEARSRGDFGQAHAGNGRYYEAPQDWYPFRRFGLNNCAGATGKAAVVVYNGYAEEDSRGPCHEAGPGDILIIRYLGSIYRGFRDPSPLFSAIALLPDQLRPRVSVDFLATKALLS